VSEPLAVLAARAACALEQSIQQCVLASDHNLGHLERQAAQDVQNLLRATMERGRIAPKVLLPGRDAKAWGNDTLRQK
jgi:hypothetical protein